MQKSWFVFKFTCKLAYTWPPDSSKIVNERKETKKLTCFVKKINFKVKTNFYKFQNKKYIALQEFKFQEKFMTGIFQDKLNRKKCKPDQRVKFLFPREIKKIKSSFETRSRSSFFAPFPFS